MSDIEQWSGGSLSTSGRTTPAWYSQVGRALTQSQNAALIRANRVQLEQVVTELKLGAIGSVGAAAQFAIARFTELEGQLIKAVPLASSRLEMMGSIAAMGIAETTADGINRMRRI